MNLAILQEKQQQHLSAIIDDLAAAQGYMMNAAFDLETGTKSQAQRLDPKGESRIRPINPFQLLA